MPQKLMKENPDIQPKTAISLKKYAYISTIQI